MANPNRGPRALSEVLGELFTVRGYGRLRALAELEEVWNAAVGEPHCRQTRVGEVRRGVLTVIVSHPTLLEELAAFRKAELLAALRAAALATPIEDIRFRVGALDAPTPPEAKPAPGGGAKAAVPPRPPRSSNRTPPPPRRPKAESPSSPPPQPRPRTRGKKSDGPAGPS